MTQRFCSKPLALGKSNKTLLAVIFYIGDQNRSAKQHLIGTIFNQNVSRSLIIMYIALKRIFLIRKSNFNKSKYNKHQTKNGFTYTQIKPQLLQAYHILPCPKSHTISFR
jgi:hypothetical protein